MMLLCAANSEKRGQAAAVQAPGSNDTGVVCNVYPYSNSYKQLKQVPIVEAVTAYDHQAGETFILVLVQALYLGN